MDRKLYFRNDGTFKILQFTDVHWVDGCDADLKTTANMEMLLKEEKPDLVVFTGDTVYGQDNIDALRKALEPVTQANIPWAMVFGNHDAELGADKATLLRVQQENPLCLSAAGDPHISGIGNYTLHIHTLEDKPAWTLFLLDSGDHNKNSQVGGYDFIKRDQIEWYVQQSLAIEKQWGSLPALAFFHIPLQEYNIVWNLFPCYGEKNEGVCCPHQNSGLFSAMLEMGNMKSVFTGHDHINDYWGELFGIKLMYGRATGYNTYCSDTFRHGARVILLKEDSTDFISWIRLDDGSVIEHQAQGNL